MRNENDADADVTAPAGDQVAQRAAAASSREADPPESIAAGAAKLLAESDASIFVWARERIAIEEAEAERAEAEILANVLKGWKPMNGDIL